MKTKLLLLLFLFLGISYSQNLSAKIYLVSVGISDYPGDENDLKLPVSDAKMIAWLYGKNTQVKYKLLLNEKATISKILSTMRSTFSEAKSNDIVVLFFSGHGYPGGFVAYDSFIDYAQIRDAMSVCKSKNKMIFADACFAGKICTSKPESPSSISATKKANVMLFLSSRDNETSLEYKSMKNGMFTHYLQKGLRGGADTNRDRRITAIELFKYVKEHVANMTDNRQHPVMWGNFSDNMPVMHW